MIAVDRSAPAATFVTIQVIEWLRELVGYASVPISALRGVRDVAGLWTTSGHLSNHIAMLTAFGRALPQARKHGLRALDTQPAVVMAGPIAHYSHSDAAFHLGLGWDAIIQVPARPDYTTDPAAVEAVLSEPPAGGTPFMVIGVAGNCRTTGLDDLAALARVCRRHLAARWAEDPAVRKVLFINDLDGRDAGLGWELTYTHGAPCGRSKCGLSRPTPPLPGPLTWSRPAGGARHRGPVGHLASQGALRTRGRALQVHRSLPGRR